MKKLIVILCLFACCSLDKQFAKSVNDLTQTILPEYKEYIENDSTLNKDSKRIRKQSADKLEEILDEAMKEE